MTLYEIYRFIEDFLLSLIANKQIHKKLEKDEDEESYVISM
jgi:hypothetical protein